MSDTQVALKRLTPEPRLKEACLTSRFLRDCLLALRARGLTLILSLATSLFSSSVWPILSKSRDPSTPATLQQICFQYSVQMMRIFSMLLK